jgi:hypothetical protein
MMLMSITPVATITDHNDLLAIVLFYSSVSS